LGAIITPTDPVVASTLITGRTAEKYLPARVRHTLSFESSANDGLAYPIVLCSVFLFTRTEFPLQEWLLNTVLYKNVLCGIIAYFVGILAGKGMYKAHHAGLMATKTILPFSLALAFVLLAGFDAIEMNGIIAVFVGGIGFSKFINKNESLKQERVQDFME